MAQLVIIAEIGGLSNVLQHHLLEASTDLNIQSDEKEALFDWLISEAFQNAFCVRVAGHYRHDVYKCVYTVIGLALEQQLRLLMASLGITIAERQIVKLLVTYREVFIVKSF